MKTKTYLFLSGVFFLMSCGAKTNEAENRKEQETSDMVKVVLTDEQVHKLNIKVDDLAEFTFTESIDGNGKLVISPQSEATITPQIGGNIKQILVQEGQTVSKGQTVAYLSHPDFANLQTQYLSALNRQKYLRKEYERQTMMMNEGVGAGKDYDRTKSELQIANGELSMLSAQLGQMGISPSAVLNGNPKMNITVKSPINGTVEQVDVQMGQFVSPEMSMMKIANTNNIFADLKIFQRDILKVKVGQMVTLELPNAKGTTYKGKVYSIGKTFNAETQTVDVRVHIEGERTGLIAGMYIQAQIAANMSKMKAVPSEAIVEENGKSYIFTSLRQGKTWQFSPIPVKKIKEERGLVAIELPESKANLSQIAQSGAYYILSEMKKGETGEE
ncbi:MAG: efflux RND transporter periplasmic adaptor subunit [Prevotella sp.]|nr:efflux RND transporter periplasmic adaptor subunit [Prevotella sp.]